MSCNCSKCNPNKPCGCADSALHTPCSYTDCSIGSERCDDVQCAECVSYCGTSFQVVFPGEGDLILKVEQGQRLDSIIQMFALMITNGLNTCNAYNVHHAPYNVYATNITNTKVDILWNGESPFTTGISVYYDTVIAPSGWILANTIPVAPTVLTYQLANLTPTTQYKIKLVSSDGVLVCESVEILITTLI
jgi:hypothetical protein